MERMDVNKLNEELIEFLLSFPFPYSDILQEQVSVCSLSNRLYPDCYIIVFDCQKNVKPLPLWLPTVPLGCQVLKESGPLSCQLYIEAGYIAQFEVIDMGMNEIDWEYFWSHKPIYDIEYDSTLICNYLTTGRIKITKALTGQQHILFYADTPTGRHTVCLWGCSIQAFHIPREPFSCSISILGTNKAESQFLLLSDDGNIIVECAMLCLQDGLILG